MIKNKTTLALAILTCSLALSACQPKKTDQIPEDSLQTASQVVEKDLPSLQGDTEKLALQLPECGGKNCPELSVERLQTNQAVLDHIIDQAILDNLQKMLSIAEEDTKSGDKKQVEAANASSQAASAVVTEQDPTQQLTAKIQPYVNTFLAIDQELKSNGVGHKISLTISPRILNTEAPIATVVLNSSSYLGGAHGASAQHYFNFDLERQKQVKLQDLLEDNQKAALKALLYKRFKTWVIESKLASNIAEYEQVWKFNLTDNFYLAKQGLILQYGEYEIGPYVVGLPRFEIPYSELKGIIKPEYLSTEALNQMQQASAVAAVSK